jgi:hypothetical protein
MSTDGTRIRAIIYLVIVKHVVTEITAGSTERTSGYFGDQTPSESKKPRFLSRIRFYHFWRTPLSQPLLDQSDQSARFYFTCYLRRLRHLWISLELLK